MKAVAYRGLAPVIKNTGTYKSHANGAPPAVHAPAAPQKKGSRRCVIVSTPHNLFLAYLMERELIDAGYDVTTTLQYDPQMKADYLFALSGHHFPDLPPWTIYFQLEQMQSDRWNNENYLAILRRAGTILDYSIDNIRILEERGIEYNRLYYVPLDMAPGLEATAPAVEKDIDVLFYGSTSSARRLDLLDGLGKQLNITVLSDVFDAEIRTWIRRARVVVNLHYYEDARLEAMRIFECLSLGTPVVSETTEDAASYPDIQNVVDFVPLGDVDAMVLAVRRLLESSGAHRYRQLEIAALSAKGNRFTNYFGRFMVAFGMTTFERFFARSVGYAPNLTSTPKLCLTLPETPVRRTKFAGEHPEYALFDGLRFLPGWRGCGLSYKYLFTALQRSNAKYAIICEDDVVFSEDHCKRLERILEQLSGMEDEWDVFCGIIADLHEDTKVNRVKVVGNDTLVWLDRAVSTVFNVYSRQAIERLSNWDETDGNPATNTLDRFMERMGLRFVTTSPFLVGHDEEHKSTLWGFQNSQYTPMIAASVELLNKKIREHAT